MLNKFVAATLVTICAAGVVGCKSTSQLAWWKSANKSDIESTAMAHSAAPQLPSEAARQAEGLAVNVSPPTAGGGAVPFVPGNATALASTVASTAMPASSPASYPATGMPSHAMATTANAHTHATNSATQMASSHVGTLAMPYDPNAVPQSSGEVVAQVASPTVSAERYGAASHATTPATSTPPAYTPMGSEALASTTPASVPPAYQSTNSRYAATSVPTSTIPGNRGGLASKSMPVAAAETAPNQYAVSEPAQYPAIPSQNSAFNGGDRYAATSAVSPAVNSPIASSGGAAIGSAIPTASVANASSYRPGGTSSYPNSMTTQPTTQIASRPDTTAVNTDAAATLSPDTTVPGTLTPPPLPAARYR